MNEIQLDFGIYERSFRLKNGKNVPLARIWHFADLSTADRAVLQEQEGRYLREKPYLAQALRRS